MEEYAYNGNDLEDRESNTIPIKNQGLQKKKKNQWLQFTLVSAIWASDNHKKVQLDIDGSSALETTTVFFFLIPC